MHCWLGETLVRKILDYGSPLRMMHPICCHSVFLAALGTKRCKLEARFSHTLFNSDCQTIHKSSGSLGSTHSQQHVHLPRIIVSTGTIGTNAGSGA